MILRAYRDLFALPRIHWVLFAGILVNRMGTMVLPFFTLYLTEARGFTPKVAGLYLALYGLVAVVATPLAGNLADRIGAAKLLCFGLFAAGLVQLVFPFVPTDISLVIATVLLAVATEIYRPMVFTLCADLAKPTERMHAVALARLGANVGMSMGPALGGVLASYSYRALFFVDGVTTLIAGAISYYFMVVRRWVPDSHLGEGAKQERTSLIKDFTIAWQDRTFRYLWLGVLFMAILFFQHESTWPLILVQEKGLSEKTFGLIFTINTVLIILFELPFTVWLQRFSSSLVLVTGTAFMAVGVCGIVFVRSAWELVALVVSFTIGEMMSFPISTNIVGVLAPESKRGAYMGIYMMSFSVAFVIGGSLGPALWEWLGTNAFSVALIGFAAASVGFFRQVRPTPNPTSK